MEWSSQMNNLKEGQVAPVYTLVGEEFILAKRWLDELRRTLMRDGVEVELNRFDFEDEGCDNALLACQSVSLFSDSSLVLLDRCSFLLGSSKSGHDLSQLEHYLENPVAGRVLILKVSAEKMDERKKIVKRLRKYPVISLATPKPEDALGFLKDVAEDKGCSIADDALRELWRRCQSISLCDVELDKLSAYVGLRRIELIDVQEVVSSPLEDNVFNWIDGVVKGNVEQTFRSLNDVQNAGYDTFALMALMARQWRILWFTKVLGDRGYSFNQIAKELSVHPYSVKMAAGQARLLSAKVIETILVALADAEFWVKSGKWDANLALEYIVLLASGLIRERPGKITR